MNAKKKKDMQEGKESEKDKQILINAISRLFEAYNNNYGALKKFKRGQYLVIVAITGGWSENEEAIAKFNKTKFGGIATIEWWFLNEWKRGGYFKWEIPLFLLENK